MLQELRQAIAEIELITKQRLGDDSSVKQDFTRKGES
jgi:hypothetical protein